MGQPSTPSCNNTQLQTCKHAHMHISAPPADIQVLKRPDGSLWRLGAGGFGTVFKALLHGVQPVAVKASAPKQGWWRLWVYAPRQGMHAGDACSSCCRWPALWGCRQVPDDCTPTACLSWLTTTAGSEERPAADHPLQVLGGSAAPGSQEMSAAAWEHEIAVLRACRHTHIIQFQVGRGCEVCAR